MILHDTDAENLFLNHTDSISDYAETTLSNYDKLRVQYFRKKLLDIQVITSALANIHPRITKPKSGRLENLSA